MLKKQFNYNVSTNEQHPFHLVDVSPWPLMTSISLFSLVLSFVMYFHFFENGSFYFLESLFILCFYLCRWFSDIVLEATYEGHHTFKVQRGIRLGMCLFIASEVMFFFSFFWAFFSCKLSSICWYSCYMTSYRCWNLRRMRITFIKYDYFIIFRCNNYLSS